MVIVFWLNHIVTTETQPGINGISSDIFCTRAQVCIDDSHFSQLQTASNEKRRISMYCV